MTLDESFRLALARLQAEGCRVPWVPGDPVVREIFEAGWLGHIESLKQAQMFAVAEGAATTQGAYPAATIYGAYPKKVGKSAALAAIEKVLRTMKKEGMNNGPTYLLKRTEQYRDAVALCNEYYKRFIPHPASWFNAGCYDDDQTQWVRGVVAPKSQFSKSY